MKLLSSKKNLSSSGDVAILSASLVVTYGIQLVTAMLLSRYRTLGEYGTYSQMLMVVNLVTMLLMMGLPTSINYFLARAETKAERNRFVSAYYIFNTVLGFVVGALLVAAVPLIERYFGNGEISKYAYFLALYPWTMIITGSVDNLLIVQKQSRLLVTYRILHSLAIVGCVLIVQWCALGFSAYVFWFLTIELVSSAVVILFAVRLDGMIRVRADWSLIKDILVFSIPLGLSVAITTLNSELDKFVIGHFVSTDQYAIYANAAKELPFNFIATSIAAVFLPIITRKIKHDQMREAVDLWKETITLSFLITAFFSFGLATFSKDAIVFLYSEKYAPGATVFAIYSLVLLFRTTYFGTILQCTNNTKYILRSSILSLALNVVLNVALYYAIGFIGPAIATILAVAINAMYLLVITRRITKIPLKALFPWKSVASITLVNLAFSALFFALKRVIPLEQLVGESWEGILLAGVWALLYFGIFFRFIKGKLQTIKQYEEPSEGETAGGKTLEQEQSTD